MAINYSAAQLVVLDDQPLTKLTTLAAYSWAKTQESMQIILYDRQGKVQHRSPEFIWCEPPRVLQLGACPTGLFWNPDGTRLVVYDLLSEGDKLTTGIYDVGRKHMNILPGRPLVFASNLVRPDAKGFLIFNGVDKQLSEVAFVDWDGKKQKIDMKPDTFDTEDKRAMIAMPFLFASGWQGDTAIVTCAGVSIHIDTNKRVGTCHKVPQDEAKVGQPLHEYTFPGNGARVRVLVSGKDGKEKENETSLKVLKPGQDRPRIIRASNVVILFPSPDGKYLAISWHGKESGSLHILILDSAGEVVADMETKEK